LPDFGEFCEAARVGLYRLFFSSLSIGKELLHACLLRLSNNLDRKMSLTFERRS
jgi:hypothetical protein